AFPTRSNRRPTRPPKPHRRTGIGFVGEDSSGTDLNISIYSLNPKFEFLNSSEPSLMKTETEPSRPRSKRKSGLKWKTIVAVMGGLAALLTALAAFLPSLTPFLHKKDSGQSTADTVTTYDPLKEGEKDVTAWLAAFKQ